MPKTKPTREVGDRITIYRDPHTQCETEGEADLVRFSFGDELSEYWEVRFVNEPDDTFIRIIRKEKVT